MNHLAPFLPRTLPAELEILADLATDLRWTWSHAGDELWKSMDTETWTRTGNPYMVLQNLPEERVEQLSKDPRFRERLHQLSQQRQVYLEQPGWYGASHADKSLRGVAYFSMEFGLGEALPLYAGGLGVLAGDYLKTASDLAVPVVGVGLLYQEGYFRQSVDSDGWQQEAYPYNDPTSLPIVPVQSRGGAWLHVYSDFPGRRVRFRVWQAQVGRITLYLLDSNDPLNSPTDRGITGKLYGGGQEMRLVQEIALGICGWRLIEALGLGIDICHLNEGHAAFVTLERARCYMDREGVDFWEALWATRAGNLFTTHTPVAAGFDTYAPSLMLKYGADYATALGVKLEAIGALGRADPGDENEPFNMAYLAMRTCGMTNAVSCLHGEVSRRIFAALYPRWPQTDVPVSHVTNGVHVPSWDSPWADEIWTRACGKDRWLGNLQAMGSAIENISDEALWTFDAHERSDLVNYARERLALQLGQRGADPDTVNAAQTVLDPNVLTLAFARRFAEYKRPNLLLHQPERLIRLLTNAKRPLQIIVAGKAHPADETGKRLVQEWVRFVQRSEVRNRAVFLEDYDIALAQQMVQGVDVWINTPRRPWEASGTSGMKVLANGGLNLSELDGWWAEAYTPDAGWALGNGQEHKQAGWDGFEARQLYDVLEQQVVPMFYERDASGIPRAWVARMRASMARLAPHYSSNRMVREYVTQMYLPAAAAYQRRTAQAGRVAKSLNIWASDLRRHWQTAHFGKLEAQHAENGIRVQIQVYLGDISPDAVQAQLYADAAGTQQAVSVPMLRGKPIPGAVNGYVYEATVPETRSESDYTARLVPYHPEARVPAELELILWQH